RIKPAGLAVGFDGAFVLQTELRPAVQIRGPSREKRSGGSERYTPQNETKPSGANQPPCLFQSHQPDVRLNCFKAKTDQTIIPRARDSYIHFLRSDGEDFMDFF